MKVCALCKTCTPIFSELALFKQRPKVCVIFHRLHAACWPVPKSFRMQSHPGSDWTPHEKKTWHWYVVWRCNSSKALHWPFWSHDRSHHSLAGGIQAYCLDLQHAATCCPSWEGTSVWRTSFTCRRNRVLQCCFSSFVFQLCEVFFKIFQWMFYWRTKCIAQLNVKTMNRLR